MTINLVCLQCGDMFGVKGERIPFRTGAYRIPEYFRTKPCLKCGGRVISERAEARDHKRARILKEKAALSAWAELTGKGV